MGCLFCPCSATVSSRKSPRTPAPQNAAPRDVRVSPLTSLTSRGGGVPPSLLLPELSEVFLLSTEFQATGKPAHHFGRIFNCFSTKTDLTEGPYASPSLPSPGKHNHLNALKNTHAARTTRFMLEVKWELETLDSFF